MQIFHVNVSVLRKNCENFYFFMKGNAFFRVRDWKGYGIVQQCGTCEPLQSPTDVALERMICRTIEGTPK